MFTGVANIEGPIGRDRSEFSRSAAWAALGNPPESDNHWVNIVSLIPLSTPSL